MLVQRAPTAVRHDSSWERTLDSGCLPQTNERKPWSCKSWKPFTSLDLDSDYAGVIVLNLTVFFPECWGQWTD